MKRKGIARKHVETSAVWTCKRRGGGYTPHYMHEFENKGVAKWAPRKYMKRKARFLLASRWGETQNGNGTAGRGKKEIGEDVMRETQNRVAQNSLFVNVYYGYHSNGAGSF